MKAWHAGDGYPTREGGARTASGAASWKSRSSRKNPCDYSGLNTHRWCDMTTSTSISAARPSFGTSVVQHAAMRAAWHVRLDGERQPRAALEPQPAGAMLLLAIQSAAAIGSVSADDHGGADFYGLLFNVGGRQCIKGNHPDFMLQPGDVLLWNSRTSCNFEVPAALHEFQILVPLDLFEQTWPGLALEGAPRHLTTGPVALALAHGGVQTLWTQRQQFSQEELRSGLDAIVDLLGKACRSPWTPSRSKSMLFEDILRHIDRELDDPELAPTSLAQRHGCSVRSLQALFAERQLTVAGAIRQKRLERCRQALCADGGSNHIGNLALHWGFGDAAHFSKLFKATYGLSPRQYRQLNGAQ
jgi:AraC family transcriptional activator of tynA and feaB